MAKGKDALLQWAIRVCAQHGVKVTNFTTSFKDGLAFCALVHDANPAALTLSAMRKKSPLDRLNTAFDVALTMGVPRLLDAEDLLDLPVPDRLSNITYLSEMYHVFKAVAGANAGAKAGSGRSFGLAGISSDAVVPKLVPTKGDLPKGMPTKGDLPKEMPTKGDLHKEMPRKENVPMPRKENVPDVLCAKCGCLLRGDVANFGGVAFHLACFTCAEEGCRVALGDRVVAVEGRPFCAEHGAKAFDLLEENKPKAPQRKAITSPAPVKRKESIVDVLRKAVDIPAVAPVEPVKGIESKGPALPPKKGKPVVAPAHVAPITIKKPVLKENKTCGDCKTCGAAVFERERVDLDELLFHRTCFRCAVCARRGIGGVTLSAEHEPKLRLVCQEHGKAAPVAPAVTSKTELPGPDPSPDWTGAFRRASLASDVDEPPPLPTKKARSKTDAVVAKRRPSTIQMQRQTASEFAAHARALRESTSLDDLAAMEPEPLEGELLKKGVDGFLNPWRRRLFVLRGDQVLYYVDNAHRSSDVLQGIITLRGASVDRVIGETAPGQFQISTPGRVWMLQAADDEDRTRWITNLRIAAARATKAALHHDETDTKQERKRRHAAVKEGLVHVMKGVNERWDAKWLVVRDGVLAVCEAEGERPRIKIPLYRCGLAEYNKDQPPPNMETMLSSIGGSLRRLVSKREEITDFRNAFQVCGANKSVVIQVDSIETMHLWLNAILINKLATEAIIDSLQVDL